VLKGVLDLYDSLGDEYSLIEGHGVDLRVGQGVDLGDLRPFPQNENSAEGMEKYSCDGIR
jgi:hypothetical protein